MMSTEGEGLDISYDLEDGELEESDLEEGVYIPLRRPDNFHPLPAVQDMQLQDELSNDSHQESSSDSDSDSDRNSYRPKKAKIKVERPQVQNAPFNKRKKYEIWSKPLQDEVLTEELLSCDVGKNRRYGVESYDHTIKYRLKDDSHNEEDNEQKYESGFRNKRSSFDRKNPKLRLGGCDKFNRKDKNARKKVPKTKIILNKLSVDDTNSVEDVAADIADKLCEEKISLVVKIVEAIGTAKAIEIYNSTKRIEADGGVLVINGRRRRTSGGVFFFMLKKDDAIKSTVEAVFALENENIKKIKREKKLIETAQSSEPEQSEQSDRSDPAYHDQLADYRLQKVEELKKTLTDADLACLGTKVELCAELPQPATNDPQLSPNPSLPPALSNPPPSPATDTEATVSTCLLDAYQEDFLDITTVDDMDLF